MIKPESLPMVRTPSMNDAHYETMLLINQLSSAIEAYDIALIKEIFDRLIEHTKEHFMHEEEMMIEKQFPPYAAHKEEHDLAMADMLQIAELLVETENINALQEYLDANLIPWFLTHTETMDQVTSMFLENSEVHLEFWKKLKPRNSNSN